MKPTIHIDKVKVSTGTEQDNQSAPAAGPGLTPAPMVIALITALAGTLQAGIHTLTANPAASDANVLAAPQQSPRFKEMIGINVSLKNGLTQCLADMDICYNAGFSACRMDWAKDYIDGDFAGRIGLMDAVVNKAVSRGKKVVLVMTNFADAPDTAAKQGDYFDYCRDNVQSRYAAQSAHVVLEVYNEANFSWPESTRTGQIYRGLLDQSLGGIDASANASGNAGVSVISSGIIRNDDPLRTRNYLKDMIYTGGEPGSARFKGYGYHPYFWYWGERPFKRIEDGGLMNTARNDALGSKPFFNTEFGYSSCSFDDTGHHVYNADSTARFDFWGAGGGSRFGQAKYTVQQALLEWSLGLPLACVYEYRDSLGPNYVWDASDREDNFGLVDANGNAKAAWSMFNPLFSLTQNYALRGRYNFGPTAASDEIVALKFGGRKDTTYAVWSGVPNAVPTLNFVVPAGMSCAVFNTWGTQVATYAPLATARTVTETLGENDGLRYYKIYAAPANDFNNDGKSDLLWRNTDGSVAIWSMDGAGISAPSGMVRAQVPNGWKITGTGDFNADGKADILWRHTDGTLAIWLMNGLTVIDERAYGPVNNSWKTVGTGDFNGDGSADVLWRNTDGSNAIWFMNGLTFVDGLHIRWADNTWKIEGTADFNADGKTDILWRRNDGLMDIYIMDGANVVADNYYGPIGQEWQIEGSTDFNADGIADILWRHVDGWVATWHMNATGNTVTIGTGQIIGQAANAYTIQGTGDYNGDRNGDIIWTNPAGNYIWFLNGTSSNHVALPTPDASWFLAAPVF
jgi:FG-GAP-like repeat